VLARARAQNPGPSSCLYSPKYLEEEFSEVHGSKRFLYVPPSPCLRALLPPFVVKTLRLGTIRCTFLYQGVATRNSATTREMLAQQGSQYNTRTILQGRGFRLRSLYCHKHGLLVIEPLDRSLGHVPRFLHSLLATCGLLLGCQTPPSRTCGFSRSLINGCGSFCLLLRITAAP
jgi:hypothetical protein